MTIKIYKPSKSSMQSGLGKTKQWLAEYISEKDKTKDSLMGWNSSLDTKEQIKIEFDEIVISAGAWSNIVANMIGENFPLDTERGYHVLFETNKKLIDRPIGWSQSGFYLIQIEEGIRAAGTVEIAGLKKSPNEKRIKMIEKKQQQKIKIRREKKIFKNGEKIDKKQ